MNAFFPRISAPRSKRSSALLIAGLWAVSWAVQAGPGAHGPNGEHLDTPAAQIGGTGPAAPRLETHSEVFELVASLAGGALSIYIDRYDSNEPVLDGQVEVEALGLKAAARRREDQDDYAVDDPRMLAALAKPGQHPLVFTVTAGENTDLLDGVLTVNQAMASTAGGVDGLAQEHVDHDKNASPGSGHVHGSLSKALWIVGGLTLLAGVAWLASLRLKRSGPAPLPSGTNPRET